MSWCAIGLTLPFAVGGVSRLMTNLGKAHWNTMKWILCYLKGISRLCLCFGSGNPALQGYIDAYYAGDVDY
jgi:ATP-binding cassette subfamily B (MDR/TAP) protein 1